MKKMKALLPALILTALIAGCVASTRAPDLWSQARASGKNRIFCCQGERKSTKLRLGFCD